VICSRTLRHEGSHGVGKIRSVLNVAKVPVSVKQKQLRLPDPGVKLVRPSEPADEIVRTHDEQARRRHRSKGGSVVERLGARPAGDERSRYGGTERGELPLAHPVVREIGREALSRNAFVSFQLKGGDATSKSCRHIRFRHWTLNKLQERTMEDIKSTEARYELRFESLYGQGRGWAFPCDARGEVELDRLGERARNNYFFARAQMGREYAFPQVRAIA
jgi:hypothetical protein